MILLLILIVVVNQLLKYQISQLVNLFIMIAIPFVFSLNQSFIFKIDHDAGMKESIVLKSSSYIKIILNRWLVLVLIQIFVQLAGIIIVHFYSHSLPAVYTIYILLLGILISLINLFVNVSTRSIGLANILLFIMIYIQLNEDIVLVVEKYTFLSIVHFIYPEVSLIDMHMCFLVFLFIGVLLIITSTIIQLTKYAHLRFARWICYDIVLHIFFSLMVSKKKEIEKSTWTFLWKYSGNNWNVSDKIWKLQIVANYIGHVYDLFPAYDTNDIEIDPVCLVNLQI